MACPKFSNRCLELSAASEAAEAAATAGDQNLSSDSTTKNVCEHSAADQFEVLHVSVCCTAGWV